MTTSQPIGTHLNGILANHGKNQVAIQQPQPSQPPNPLLLGETPLRDSVECQNQLTMLIQQTYACQRTYADKAEMMEYRDGMFQEILKEYALFEIKRAFIEHVRTSPNLPTPSDIVMLIEEDRRYRLLKKPDVDRLLSYREKGIPLTQQQKETLEEYDRGKNS